MKNARSVLVLLSCLLSACVAAEDGCTHRVAMVRGGFACAPDYELASSIACVVAEELPGVLRLPSTSANGLRVHATRRETDVARGWTRGSRIDLEVGPVPESAFRGVIVHELVHASLRAPWSCLPMPVEEGLADVMSMRNNAAMERAKRTEHGVFLASASPSGLRVGATTILARHPLPSPLETLSIDRATFAAIPEGHRRSVLLAQGFVVALRIGPDHLYELCLRAERRGLARLPATWLLEEAGLGEDPGPWYELALELVDRATLDQVVERSQAEPEQLPELELRRD